MPKQPRTNAERSTPRDSNHIASIANLDCNTFPNTYTNTYTNTHHDTNRYAIKPNSDTRDNC